LAVVALAAVDPSWTRCWDPRDLLGPVSIIRGSPSPHVAKKMVTTEEKLGLSAGFQRLPSALVPRQASFQGPFPTSHSHPTAFSIRLSAPLPKPRRLSTRFPCLPGAPSPGVSGHGGSPVRLGIGFSWRSTKLQAEDQLSRWLWCSFWHGSH